MAAEGALGAFGAPPAHFDLASAPPAAGGFGAPAAPGPETTTIVVSEWMPGEPGELPTSKADTAFIVKLTTPMVRARACGSDDRWAAVAHLLARCNLRLTGCAPLSARARPPNTRCCRRARSLTSTHSAGIPPLTTSSSTAAPDNCSMGLRRAQM